MGSDAGLFLANLLVILLSAKVFGELAERLKQPAVLGELLGGVLLGAGLFPFFSPGDPVLAQMAGLGVILLMFETGINSDPARLLEAGPISLAVACVGVLLPFLLGWGAMTALGQGGLRAVFVGASLTATSVGITARVLADMGRLDTDESRIVLGAAVIDDVLGLVILSAVQGLALSGSFSWGAAARTSFLAAGFLAAALAAGPYLANRLVRIAEGMRVRGMLIVASVCFAFALALLAHAAGTAFIVGAFTAGLLLARTERKTQIDAALKPVSDLFVPFFFVSVGAQVRLGAFNPLIPENRQLWGVAALLILLAVAGKIACGWAVRGKGLNRWGIGIGMIPRGEVGLIFAQFGLAAGVIGPPLFAAIVVMVMVTTFIAPPLLQWAYQEPR